MKKLKKSSFIDGAIIGTVSLIICKIMGLIYVIPFYKIIGSQGGALYSYAYSIYAIFLNLSTVGIPSAIAKIISEYDTLEYYHAKNKSFKIASNMLNYIGIFSFIIMFTFADVIAKSIIGDVTGGNSVESVATAIRVVSTALLIVPRLSILKGYFQGHKYLTETSLSNVLEQFVRVVLIIVGSYTTVKVLHLPIDVAVYIATFGATLGAISAFIYLKIKSKNLPKEEKKEIKEEEVSLTTKVIVKKIIIYALPFVIMSLLQSAYRIVDTFTVVRTLTSLGYDVKVAESTFGVISTWASKLNMIVISISVGLAGSLIPNVVGSFVKGDYKDVNEKFNLSFKMLLLLTIPMSIGMSILAEPVWHLFYGVDALNSSIFRIAILEVIIYGLFTTSTTITQSMNQTKITISALIASFLLKAILNIPMMHLFKFIGIPAYYATTVTDAIAQCSALIYVMLLLKKNFGFNYKTLYPFLFKVLIGVGSMSAVLLLIRKFIFFSNASIIMALVTIILYVIIGGILYFVIVEKFKLPEEILGNDYKNKLLSKFRKGSKA